MASQSWREDHSLKKQLAEAARETALLAMLARNEAEDDEDRALILLRSHVANYAIYREWLKKSYEELFSAQFGLETRSLTADHKLFLRLDDWLLARGACASRLAAAEQGTHLYFDENEVIAPVQVVVFPLRPGARPREAMREEIRERKRWIERLTMNEASVNDDPHPLGPVIRIYDQSAGQTRTTVDLRSGITIPRFPTMDDLRAFLSSSLELPLELQTIEKAGREITEKTE
jgi:hypothetical protein